MKTLVVGTGVIGDACGWALTEAGVDVAHYVRPSWPDAGTVPRGVPGRARRAPGAPQGKTASPPTRCAAWRRSTPRTGTGFVLVAVNAHQLAEVLATLKPLVGPDATFLLMTSNWDGTAAVDALLPRGAACPDYPELRRDRTRRGLPGRARRPRAPRRARGPVGAAPRRGGGAVRVGHHATRRAGADILHWLWVHNASATGFAAGYAKYGGVKELIADRPLLRTCVQATVEALRLCQTRRVALEQYPEVSFVGWPTWVVMTFVRRMWFTNPSMRRYTSDAASPDRLRGDHAALRRRRGGRRTSSGSRCRPWRAWRRTSQAQQSRPPEPVGQGTAAGLGDIASPRATPRGPRVPSPQGRRAGPADEETPDAPTRADRGAVGSPGRHRAGTRPPPAGDPRRVGPALRRAGPGLERGAQRHARGRGRRPAGRAGTRRGLRRGRRCDLARRTGLERVTAVDISRVALDRAASFELPAPVSRCGGWSRTSPTARRPARCSTWSARGGPAIRHTDDDAGIRGLMAAVGPGGTLLVVGHGKARPTTRPASTSATAVRATTAGSSPPTWRPGWTTDG